MDRQTGRQPDTYARTHTHTNTHTHTQTHAKLSDLGSKKDCDDLIAVARVTVWRSITVSLYTVFPLWAVVLRRNFQKKVRFNRLEMLWNALKWKKNAPYEWHFPLPQNAQKFQKKSVSQSTRIALKRIEIQKKITPMSGISLCRRMLKISKKKGVFQSTRIALKRIEMQKHFPLISGVFLCRRMLKF